MKHVGAILRSGFPFNYDADKASEDSGLQCRDKSLALQSQAKEADINNIVRNFGLTGQLPQNVRVPLQEDFVDLCTYHDALNALKAADLAFSQMPAAVRARFDNDPALFVEFCSETTVDRDGEPVLANLDEMRKMGLAVGAVAVQEVPAPVKENPPSGGS